jgi:hypothetical protein
MKSAHETFAFKLATSKSAVDGAKKKWMPRKGVSAQGCTLAGTKVQNYRTTDIHDVDNGIFC